MGVGTTGSVDTLDGIGFLTGGESVNKRVTFAKDVKPATLAKRRTPCPWKLYLDSCATYSSMFVQWYLDNIAPSRVHLKGHCNAGTLTCTHQGF